MRRRRLLQLAAGAVSCAARPAWAQGLAAPLIGFLNGGSSDRSESIVSGFQAGLREAGFAEGQNARVEYRWADGSYERFPALLDELLAQRVSLVVTGGGASGSWLLADPRVRTLPIVFVTGGDPVQAGLVASLNRPGGMITGVAQFTIDLEAKRLALLREAVPAAQSVAVLLNPTFPGSRGQRRDLAEAAPRAGLRLIEANAARESEFAAAFAAIVAQGAAALLVGADPYFYSRRAALVALAAQHRMPAMYELRDFVTGGGLMSYGTMLGDTYRQAGAYVGRILLGANPGELPVVQSTRFETAVNLRTARVLGLTLSATFVAQADDVIE
jgi:putative ABC transport system substrate-binding protein